MTAAVFGLVGVLLGGLITFGIEWWHDRAGRKRRTVAAARLLYREFTSAAAAIDTCIKRQQIVHAVLDNMVRTDRFEEYEPFLAGEVSDDTWRALITAYSGVATLSSTIASHGPHTPLDPDSETDRSAFEHMTVVIDRLDHAIELLEDLVGGEKQADSA